MLRRVYLDLTALAAPISVGFIGAPLLMKCAATLRQTNWLPLASNTLVDFFAMNWDVFRRADADAYLVAFHGDDCHGDVVADDHSLTHSSCQYQHGCSLALKGTIDADPRIGNLRKNVPVASLVGTSLYRY